MDLLMDVWIYDGWMDLLMNGKFIDGYIYLWIDCFIDVWIDISMYRCFHWCMGGFIDRCIALMTDGFIYWRMDGFIDRWILFSLIDLFLMDKRIYWRMYGFIDCWMDLLMHGWIDFRMDKSLGKFMNLIIYDEVIDVWM